jgi:hypothetical protein
MTFKKRRVKLSAIFFLRNCIALAYLGCASVILQVASKILNTGIQYLPVDSIQTSLQELECSHSDSSRSPFVKVEKRLDL